MKLHLSYTEGKDARMSFVSKSIKKHVDEINLLFSTNNEHWAVETGDLMIHCMEMLSLYDFDLNEMFDKCCDRFEKKITEKMKEKR